MYRKFRIILAMLFFIAITMLFLDFTGVAQQWWGWIAKVQFVPAFLSLNVIAIVILLLLTLIFGRAYCSVICPLGILQDILIHIRGLVGKKKSRKNRFNYAKPKTWLRLGILIIFVVLLGIAGAIESEVQPENIAPIPPKLVQFKRYGASLRDVQPWNV